jgi:hypothetical protein
MVGIYGQIIEINKNIYCLTRSLDPLAAVAFVTSSSGHFFPRVAAPEIDWAEGALNRPVTMLKAVSSSREIAILSAKSPSRLLGAPFRSSQYLGCSARMCS